MRSNELFAFYRNTLQFFSLDLQTRAQRHILGLGSGLEELLQLLVHLAGSGNLQPPVPPTDVALQDNTTQMALWQAPKGCGEALRNESS